MVTKVKRPAVKGAGKSRAGGNRPGTASTRQDPNLPGVSPYYKPGQGIPQEHGTSSNPYDHPKFDAHGNVIPQPPQQVGVSQALPGKKKTVPTPQQQHDSMYPPKGPAGPAGPVKPAAAPKEVNAKFDLNSALAQYLAPYIQDSKQAAGAASAQGIGAYLQGVPAGIANTLQQGATAENQAFGGMGQALQTEANQAGNAGLLADLLNAAKYQAIYKQSLYGAAPSDKTTEGQLYQQVTAGGGALTGTPFTGSAIQPTTGAKTQNAPLTTGG